MAIAAANVTKTTIQAQQGWRRLIKPYLYSTLAISTSVTVGDFICQYLERNKNNRESDTTLSSSSLLPWWNDQRSSIMCTSAVIATTPWHFTLARTVERLFPGKQSVQIAKKMLTNTLLAPIGISLVFTVVTLLKGQNLREARTKVENDMPKTFLAGTCYWPFISFINFRFIPLDYRAFTGSLAGAVWNVYISSVVNKTPESSNDIPQPSIGITTTTSIAETERMKVSTLLQASNASDNNKKIVICRIQILNVWLNYSRKATKVKKEKKLGYFVFL